MAFETSSAGVSPVSDDAETRYREDLGAVDTALRLPLTSLLGWSAIWIVIAAALGFLASWKFHAPGLLAEGSWSTYGRLYPAATNALIYGWGFNAAVAVGAWLFSRLAGSAPRGHRFATVAIWFCNFAVLSGVAGILLGESSGVEWFELPPFAATVLLVSFFVLGSWAITTLRGRRFEPIFISQWYVIAGFFWFAWIFTTALIMLDFFPVRGTVQAIIGAWYAQGLFALFFGSIALAAIYYFLPKLSGRPVRYYSLAVVGFWTYGVFNGWLGVQRLVGAPVPAWVQSVGVAMNLLSLAPVAIIGINILATLASSWSAVSNSPAYKFIAFAGLAFVVSSLQLALGGYSDSSHLTNITLLGHSQIFLWLLGFFTTSAFGAIYYLLPRIARGPWASAALINIHFLATALGVILIAVGLLIAGNKQAEGLESAANNFATIISSLNGGAILRTAGYGLFLIGQLAFALNVFRTFLGSFQTLEKPAYVSEPPVMEVAS
ncbi:MAG TPA: cbb3-type cytochrome c oxidase subunit I [Opitutaceae bacterium]|nr:cbb3-type cytochrome c oxidase subunit I [Opitutaceae bacterium]